MRGGRSNAWLEIVLREGRNRHIRRMLDGCDVEVLRLVRVGVGRLVLGDLGKGKVRAISAAEKSGVDGGAVRSRVGEWGRDDTPRAK